MHCLTFLGRDSLKLNFFKKGINYNYSKSETSILNLWDTFFFVPIKTVLKRKYTNPGKYQSSINNLKNL